MKNNLKNPSAWQKSIQDLNENISSIDKTADGLVFTAVMII